MIKDECLDLLELGLCGNFMSVRALVPGTLPDLEEGARHASTLALALPALASATGSD